MGRKGDWSPAEPQQVRGRLRLRGGSGRTDRSHPALPREDPRLPSPFRRILGGRDISVTAGGGSLRKRSRQIQPPVGIHLVRPKYSVTLSNYDSVYYKLISSSNNVLDQSNCIKLKIISKNVVLMKQVISTVIITTVQEK